MTAADTRRFRGDIQGLRAIAVSLVVVYHLWPDALPGGFVGVDVFFVVSGFLITGNLLASAARDGRVRLLGFWARRAKRLLPAAAVVLATTWAASLVLLPATQLATAAEQIRRKCALFPELVAGAGFGRLSENRQRGQPGAALLVVVGGGAVLPRLAVAVRRGLGGRGRGAAGAGPPTVRSCRGACWRRWRPRSSSPRSGTRSTRPRSTPRRPTSSPRPACGNSAWAACWP